MTAVVGDAWGLGGSGELRLGVVDRGSVRRDVLRPSARKRHLSPTHIHGSCNYAWNEDQTDAVLVPDERTQVALDTGQRTVTWNYPSFLDCIACHSAAVGTLGPQTNQINRVIDGRNQIDTLVAMGLFDDTAPGRRALGNDGRDPPPDDGSDTTARSSREAHVLLRRARASA